MGRTKKDIYVRVNITLPPSTLKRIDKNVERIQQWLVRHGADEKDINKVVSRSSIIKEMAETLGTEIGYESVLMGFKMKMGVDDSQMELNLEA